MFIPVKIKTSCRASSRLQCSVWMQSFRSLFLATSRSNGSRNILMTYSEYGCRTIGTSRSRTIAPGAATQVVQRQRRHQHQRGVLYPRDQNVRLEVDSKEPRQSQPMGAAMPTDEHACSVSLPTWASVVGYEEGDTSITKQLSTGYPRFVYHPYVVQLMECIVQKYGTSVDAEDCLVLPTRGAAERCREFIEQATYSSLDQQHHQQQLTKYHDNAYIGTATATTRSALPDESNDNEYPPENESSSKAIRIVELPHVSAVLFPAQTKYAVSAKSYWQHTGEVVSSRRAEMALTNDLQTNIAKYVTACRSAEHPACGGSVATSAVDAGNQHGPNKTQRSQKNHYGTTPMAATTTSTTLLPQNDTTSQVVGSTTDYDLLLRRRIAEWTGCVEEDHVWLAPSGMGAIYTALRASRRYQFQHQPRAGASLVFGFPYLDTLKLCSRTELCPEGVEFFGHGDAKDLHQLKVLLDQQRKRNTVNNNNYCALFTEVPSNPLLKTPDLIALRQLADEYDFLLIVDDTISNFLNVNVLSNGIADAICTSLTKLVSGRGDAIAGSIVTNPYTERGRYLQEDLNHHHDKTVLFHSDAQAIYNNSMDFVERNARINDTAQRFATWLEESHRDKVAKVYYPKNHHPPHETNYYTNVMREGAGYGGLMSMVLHPHVCQRTFFDALDVPKGPSLGTNFTLVCPYTLLAHYHELDFAMSYNVPPNLLRIAIGLEPFEELCDKFEAAFRVSRLFPKLVGKAEP